MNPITAIKIAGLTEAARTVGGGVGKVFQGAGHVGGAVGGAIGDLAGHGEAGALLGKGLGYIAPVIAVDQATKHYGPTRRARAWLGEKAGVGGQAVGRVLVPKDFGSRPGDFPGGY